MKQPPPRWGIKIGGSLDDEKSLPGIIRAIEKIQATGAELLIIPGGGAFADFIRERCAKRNTPDSAAHFQATLGMAQFGHELAARFTNAALAHNLAETETIWAAGRIAVFIPYPFILTLDKLPHSWDATSDTISLEICKSLGVKKLVLLKSVDCVTDANGKVISEMNAANPPATDVVDPLFFGYVDERMEAHILNGRKPERLEALMMNGEEGGTRIRGD